MALLKTISMRSFLVALVTLVPFCLTGSAVAEKQACRNSRTQIQDGGAVWPTTVDCGAVTFQGASLFIGRSMDSTRLTTDIQYLQLPSPHSGIRMDLYSESGVNIGALSFGGLHIDCRNETVRRIVVPDGPGGTDFDFSYLPRVKSAELSLWVGDNNFTRC
jgi:hypothetical protein